MSNFSLEEVLPLILLSAVVVLVIIVMYIIFKRRLRKKARKVKKIDSEVASRQGVDRERVGVDHKSVQEKEFGLHIVLADNQVVFLDIPTTIGRSEDNTIVLKDDSISDHHAKIYFDDRLGAVCVEDLGSRNGIFLNGRPTTKNILEDGARLTMGEKSFTFHDTGYLPPAESMRR